MFGNGAAELATLDMQVLQVPAVHDQASLALNQLLFLGVQRESQDARNVAAAVVLGPTPAAMGVVGMGDYGSWAIGFSIAVVFSMLAAVGLNLQKYSMKKHGDESVMKQPLWVLGCMLITGGSLCDFVALGLAPQSLLAPVGGLSLCWNLMIAPFLHGEKVTEGVVRATGVILLGTTVAVVFAAKATPVYSMEDLLSFLVQPVFVGYVLLALVMLVAMAVALKNIEANSLEAERQQRTISGTESAFDDTPEDDGIISRVSSSMVELFPLPPAVVGDSGGFAHIVSYSCIAGALGSCSMTLGKATAEMAKNAIFLHSFSLLLRWEVWVVAILTLSSLMIQLTVLNKALNKFNALIVIPTYQSFFNTFTGLAGIIYFSEYRTMSNLSMAMFAVGSTIAIYGIWMLILERNGSQSSKPGFEMQYQQEQSKDASRVN